MIDNINDILGSISWDAFIGASIGGIFPILAFILQAWVTRYYEKQKILKTAPMFINIWAQQIRIAVLNNANDAERVPYEWLLSNYEVISTQQELLRRFNLLQGTYFFLKSGGYANCPQRINEDISKIDVMLKATLPIDSEKPRPKKWGILGSGL